MKPVTITLDDVEYVRADSINKKAEPLDGMGYVIVRTYSAGAFAGYLAKRNGKEGTLKRARRLWKWVGAASLSQLAMDGVSQPDKCQFPCEVSSIDLTEIIEVIPATERARQSIAGVPIWSA